MWEAAESDPIRRRLHLATRSQIGLDRPGKLKTVQHYLPELSNSGVSRLFAPTLEKKLGGRRRILMNRWTKILIPALLEEFTDENPQLSDYWMPWGLGEGEVRQELNTLVSAENDEVLGKHMAIVTSVTPKTTYSLVGTWIPDKEWLVFGRLKDPVAHDCFLKIAAESRRARRRKVNLPEPLGRKVGVEVRRLPFETPLGTRGTRDRIVGFHPVND